LVYYHYNSNDNWVQCNRMLFHLQLKKMNVIEICPLCNKPIKEIEIAVSSTEKSQMYHSKCFTEWVIENRK